MQQMLGICNSFSCLQQDCDNRRSLRALLKQGDMLDEALRKEKLHQEELDKEVNKIIFTLATLWEAPITFSSCIRSSRNSIIPLFHCCLHFHSSLQSITNHIKEIADLFADPLVRASLAVVVFIFSIVLVWLLQFPPELFTDMMYSLWYIFLFQFSISGFCLISSSAYGFNKAWIFSCAHLFTACPSQWTTVPEPQITKNKQCSLCLQPNTESIKPIRNVKHCSPAHLQGLYWGRSKTMELHLGTGEPKAPDSQWKDLWWKSGFYVSIILSTFKYFITKHNLCHISVMLADWNNAVEDSRPETRHQ